MLKFTCNINVNEDVFLHKILKSGLFTKVVSLRKDYHRLCNYEALVLMVKQMINSQIKFRRTLFKDIENIQLSKLDYRNFFFTK